MEYRKRKKRRRRNSSSVRNGYYTSHSQSRGESSGIWGIILVLLICAGLVYVLLATPVGTWLISNIFTAKTPSDLTTPPPMLSAEPSIDPTGDPKITKTIKLNTIDAYALQMGVYSKAETASGMIASLQSLGAAGFALETPEGVRILASCYSTEAAAKSVCERLRNQGYECIIYTIHMDGADADVTCSNEVMSRIESAVDYAFELITELNEEVLNFDLEERSTDYGVIIGTEFLNNIKSIRKSLKGINDGSGLIQLLDSYYLNLESYLTTYCSANTDNRVEFSGKLKYLQINAIVNYMDFLNRVNGLA